MDEAGMIQYITHTFAGVETTTAYSYTFFFYDSERKLPFATLASVDNEYDRVSHLDRPGVFRLNIGVQKPTFQSLFGTSKVDVNAYDFTALDTIMPHPDYAPQSWVCILSPSDDTFHRTVQPLLAEAYNLAVQRHVRRQSTNEQNNSQSDS
jgi:hypothetical protein